MHDPKKCVASGAYEICDVCQGHAPAVRVQPCFRNGCSTPTLSGSSFCAAHGGRVTLPTST